jgi:hypothetical protein
VLSAVDIVTLMMMSVLTFATVKVYKRMVSQAQDLRSRIDELMDSYVVNEQAMATFRPFELVEAGDEDDLVFLPKNQGKQLD